MSSIKYINDLVQGCISIVEITNIIENMKKLKVGCIPFNLENRVQNLLEWGYRLVEESGENIFSQIQTPFKEEKRENPPVVRLPLLRIPENPKSLLKLLKTLFKQVLQYFEDRNKIQSNLSIFEKRDQIDQTILEIEEIPKANILIPATIGLYANNFREHTEVIIYQLTIVVNLFPLE
jgi:hypothetical protein